MTVLVRPDAKTFFQLKPKQPHEVRDDAQIGEFELGPVVGIKYGPGERTFDADVKIDDVMSEIDEKDL